MLKILNKKMFRTEFGKSQARKYFGYRFEEDIDKFSDTVVSSQNKNTFDTDKNNCGKNQLKSKDNTSYVQIDKIDDYYEKDNIKYSIDTKISNDLSLNDIVNYYHMQGVVGEEKLICAMTLAALNRSSFGVEGYSGSGKTFIVDKLVNNLLPDVYKIQQTSDLAIFNDINNVNSSQFIYIPELQKAMQNKKSPITEVIKDLTEGKDSARIVTKKNGDGVIKQIINKDVTVIYTLALENYYKKDTESSRRLIRLKTDNSTNHLDEINKYKSEQRYTISNSEIELLQLESLLKENIQFARKLKETKVIDLFANSLSSILPVTQKSIGYIDHYYSLLDGSAKFNYSSRQKFKFQNREYILLNIEDHYNIFQIYYSEFISSLKDLSNKNESFELGRVFVDWKKWFYDGFNILRNNHNLSSIRKAFPNLVENWYNSNITNNNILVTDFLTGQSKQLAKVGELQNV